MRVLVTGSSGHLGEGLVRTLRTTSHEVVGLVASPFTSYPGSVADRDHVRRCVQGVDAVIHAATGRMMLRFVTGRPVSQVTEDYLAWVCKRLGKEGKKALPLVWDNAAWHVSKRVRAWIKTHNRAARAEGRGSQELSVTTAAGSLVLRGRLYLRALGSSAFGHCGWFD